MSYVFLVRGYAGGEVFIWLMIVGLIVLLLAGKRLGEMLRFWVKHRRMQHQWPFK